MGEIDSDEDLTKEVEPLAYYVSDRKRVLKEALRTLKGKRLEAMIPPGLKSWDRPRLEAACLNILEDIDDETLLSILDGRAATAGVAAVEQPEPEEPVKEKGKKKNKLKKLKSLNANTAVDGNEPKKKKKKKVIASAENMEAAKAAKLKKKKKLLKAKKIKEKLKKKKKAAAAAPTEVDGEPSGAAPHKSLMELLELEYRAKAIKALLRSQGQTVPDIPMNVEGEEEESKPMQATEDNKQEESENINDKITEDKTRASVSSKKNKITTQAKATASKVKETKIVPAKPSTSNANSDVLVSKPVLSNKSSQQVQTKSPSKQTPKKAVIDLIDDALNTSLSEVTDNTSSVVENVQPPFVIVEALASKDTGVEEDLRSKLLKKYQQQKQVTQAIPVVAQAKKKRKIKKPTEANDDEDILDLHPQELNLTDEEQGGANTTEDNESSAEEEEESEVEAETLDGGDKVMISTETNQIPGNDTQCQEEELIYDDTDEEEEEEEEVSNKENVNADLDEENTNLSNQDDSLWATVEEGSKVENKENAVDENESSQENENGPPQRRMSDSTRDDVFESVVSTAGDSKGNSVGITFTNSGQNLKRKLTFRIDPSRIKALEEQAVEEEAKRADERNKQEEEERLKRLEEEPEEGEIDSNEEETLAQDERNRSYGKEEQKRRRKKEKSRSPTPQRTESEKCNRYRSRNSSGHDSDDSQDSTSYYARRSSYKRKATSPSRDFGKYSPKRSVDVDKKNEEETSTKRPSSPVDFITQFSDMEPISDDDSNQSQPPQRKKKIGPVQGCSQKPADASNSGDNKDENVGGAKNTDPSDLKNTSEDSQDVSTKPDGGEDSEVEENEDDDLPKPITWYERWAQSHGMSKVVKANKIHKKVKSKLKQVKSANKNQPEVPKVPEPSVEAEPIIGSIEEYEKLFGKKVVVKSSEQEDDDSKSNDVTQPEEDDEDVDDLWGDIIGGS